MTDLSFDEKVYLSNEGFTDAVPDWLIKLVINAHRAGIKCGQKKLASGKICDSCKHKNKSSEQQPCNVCFPQFEYKEE